MRRTGLVLVALVALLAVTFAPAAAVTDGEPDGEGHPYVGIMVALGEVDPTHPGLDAMWRCSGTLIAPKVFLTAGHCTEDPAERVEIWFYSDMQTDSAAKGYPYTGQVGGTPYTHPQYDPNAFYLYDLGVVILDKPWKAGVYGALPAPDALDTLGKNVTFTSVGYGLQQSFPDAASWKEHNVKVRMVAYPRLIQINGGIVGDYSLLLSNNTNTGGTCFGDSGGPNFIGKTNVIAGVTSFGMNGTCGGTGGVYRVDRADDLGWLYNEFGKLLTSKK